jgi:two-component system C4-dicarboxylate transport response regulator DctD
VSTPPIRLLLVDDESAVRNSVGRYLERVGFAVTSVAGAAEALAALEAGPYDLVVTDHRMPLISGAELVEQLLARDPSFRGRIFLATGDPESDAALALRERTGCGVLAKPFSMADTASALRAAVPPPALPDLPRSTIQGVRSGR